MGLGFLRRVMPRRTTRRVSHARRSSFFPSSATVVSGAAAALSGTGSLTASYTQTHVMSASLSATGTMSVDNGVVLTAVTMKAPQINPSAVTMKVP